MRGLKGTLPPVIDIVGHVHQRRALAKLFQSKRLPQCLMFAGPSGVGKRLVALELARTLVCTIAPTRYGGCSCDKSKSSSRCAGCKVFDARNHPDCSFIDAAQKDLSGVEGCRELIASLHLVPLSGSVRIVLFDNAEHLSVAVANTLLKVLEEPPPRTYFFLVTSNASRLPPTLLSRCQLWFFDALTPPEVQSILEAQQPPETSEGLSTLATIADGSLANLSELKEHLSEFQSAASTIEEIVNGSRARAALLASQLGKHKETLPLQLKMLRISARQLMLRKSREGPSRHDQCARLATFITNILAAEYYLFERNLAATPVLCAVFDALAGKSYAAFTTHMNSVTLLDQLAV